MMYAVCVKKSLQDRLCSGGKIWVGWGDDYVFKTERIVTEDKALAQSWVKHFWEHVVDVSND
jgi:hypothetical protein